MRLIQHVLGVSGSRIHCLALSLGAHGHESEKQEILTLKPNHDLHDIKKKHIPYDNTTASKAHRHVKNTEGASGCPHVPAPRVQDASDVWLVRSNIAKQMVLKTRTGSPPETQPQHENRGRERLPSMRRNTTRTGRGAKLLPRSQTWWNPNEALPGEHGAHAAPNNWAAKPAHLTGIPTVAQP